MKAIYRPRNLPQALGYLVEEAGEVLAAAGKTLRWGPDSYNPELPVVDEELKSGGRETNREWVLRELLDLEGAIALARQYLGK